MTGFLPSAALLLFVFGSLALALPWSGFVYLVERMPAPSQRSPITYGLLLLAPVAALALALVVALGPWDERGLGEAIHEGCLHHIGQWNLPPAIGAVVGAALLLTLGRLVWAYRLKRPEIRAMEAADLAPDLRAKWQAVSRAVRELTGSRPPRLVPVVAPAGLCALRGGFRPALLVHDGLLAELDRDELAGAVCHELAHARHWDHLVGPALHLCFCLLAFFPGARLCYARYLEHREVAADAWAVSQTREPLALAAAIVKASRAAGGHLHTEARVRRLMQESSEPEAENRQMAPWLWAVTAALVLAVYGAVAGPDLESWHRILESLGKDLLLATGVLN